MPIHLHIFEPRYRLMMKRCIETQKPFGVVLIHSGLEAGGAAKPYLVGSSARVAKVEPLEDGRMNLTAVGEERFRILELNYDEPYLVGKVESYLLDHPQTLDTLRGARSLSPWVRSYLNLVSQLDSEMDLSLLQLPEDALMLLHWAATLLQIPPVEKQPLLEARNAGELLAGVTRLYRRETAVLRQMLRQGEPRGDSAAWMN